MHRALPIALVVPFLLAAGPAAWAARSLSGEWTLPGQVKANIDQKESGLTRAVVRLTRDGRPLKVRIKGEVAYVKIGADGGLGFTGTAASFPVTWHGKRCAVKDARLAVLGELREQKSGREYRAQGTLHGYVHCGGKNTWQRWVADLTGNWR